MVVQYLSTTTGGPIGEPSAIATVADVAEAKDAAVADCTAKVARDLFFQQKKHHFGGLSL